jgi:hypothetical protein
VSSRASAAGRRSSSRDGTTWHIAVAWSQVSAPDSRASSVAGSRSTSCNDCTIQACAFAEVIDSAVATSSTAHSLTVPSTIGRAARVAAAAAPISESGRSFEEGRDRQNSAITRARRASAIPIARCSSLSRSSSPAPASSDARSGANTSSAQPVRAGAGSSRSRGAPGATATAFSNTCSTIAEQWGADQRK